MTTAAVLLKGGLDGFGDAGVSGEHVRGEARDDVAVAVDEELFEVPKDAGGGVGDGAGAGGGEEAVELRAEARLVDLGCGLGVGEEPVERVGPRAGDGDFQRAGRRRCR